MRVIHFADLPERPASHEDPTDPGTLKRILFAKDDLIRGRVQMVNWARLLPKKSFRKHYHEDMEEVFIIISGKAQMFVGKKSAVLKKGDAVRVPVGAMHWMESRSIRSVEYITIGISREQGGRTRVV